MWTNPETGKGWTNDEERAFSSIQAVSRLKRIEAIQLWKRCKRNTTKAMELAKANYPPLTATQLASLAKATVAAASKRRRMAIGRTE